MYLRAGADWKDSPDLGEQIRTENKEEKKKEKYKLIQKNENAAIMGDLILFDV